MSMTETPLSLYVIPTDADIARAQSGILAVAEMD